MTSVVVGLYRNVNRNETSRMIKEINVQDLRVGMYVERLGVSWFNHPFARNRFLIKKEPEIEQIIECGIVTVEINTQKSIDVVLPAEKYDTEDEIFSVKRSAHKQEDVPLAEKEPVSLKEEIERSVEIYKKNLPLVHKLVDDIKKGGKIDARSVNDTVDQMVESVFRNRYAAVTLAKLKAYDEYTLTHSINVSIFALALGRQLKLSRKQLKILGSGAMLHDIGKASIPEHVLNKPGPLTEEEFRVMKTHPELGIKNLKNVENVRNEILQCILNHHEKINGTGYPQNLKGAAIGDYAKMVSIADSYDAITSTRVYQKSALAHNALKIIFSLRGEHFYTSFVERFIQVVGIYPVGTLVKLNTEEIGVVSSINPSKLLCPDIELITDKKGKKMGATQTIRLGEEYKKAPELRRKIIDIIPQKKIKDFVSEKQDLIADLH
jgi:putative nucleotidyltransferase with HDIG domain